MFVGHEDELGIGYRRSNLGQTKYRRTKGSGLNVNGSNDEEKFDGSTGIIMDCNQVPPDRH